MAAKVIGLRPIIMTVFTTNFGLTPIMIFKDISFYNLPIFLASGLLTPTHVTLSVLSVLHSTLSRVPSAILLSLIGTP